MKKILINDDCTKFIPFNKIEYFEIIHEDGDKWFTIKARTAGFTHIIEYRETKDEAIKYINDLFKDMESV